MSHKWKKYYAVLSNDHKNKYVLMMTHLQLLQRRLDSANKDFEKVVQRLKETPKYKEYDEYWKERARRIMTNEEHNTSRRLRDEALEECGFKEEYDDTASSLRQANDMVRGQRGINERFRTAVYILYDLPEPEAEKTDIPEKQCAICMEYKKDHVLPCGHVFCGVCIPKMKSRCCPNCKKSFEKNKVIKMFD